MRMSIFLVNIGKVMAKTNSCCLVRSLDTSFGMNVPQELERENDAIQSIQKT